MSEASLSIISLWQPWSNWVALGWKTIETRTHSRFRGLVGQRIGIHSALKWDEHALNAASPYLREDQILETESFLRLGGAVICTALVEDFRFLEPGDAPSALIECDTFRTGLFLRDVEVIPLVCMRGRQGIWKASLCPDATNTSGNRVPAESQTES